MKLRFVFLVFVLAFTLWATPSLRAQWVPCGPQGGCVTSFTVIGNLLFAGTEGTSYTNSPGEGVFVSSDSGVSWQQRNVGLSDTTITALASEGNYLFAATATAGLFRSSDLGMSWTSIPAMSAAVVNTFVTLGNLLFVGTSTSGIIVTRDNGNSWKAVNLGLLDTSTGTPEKDIGSLATIGSTIYANAAYDGVGGVYRSTDSGAHWVEVRNAAFSIGAVGNHLFAAMYHTVDNGVMVSTDSGSTWSEAETGGCGAYVELATTGTTVFSFHNQNGVAHSTDSGSTWIYDNVNGFYAVASLGPDLFIGNQGGIYRSTDGGATWAPSNAGIYMLSPQVPAESSLIAIGSVLIAGSSYGVFRSTDDGNDWTQEQTGLPATYRATSLSSMGSLLFAAGDGIYCSSDLGITWAPLDTEITNQWFYPCIAAMGTNLFVGTQYQTTGCWRSPDSGKSWVLANNGLVYSSDGVTFGDVTALIAQRGYLFASGNGDGGGGVFRSSDLGASWQYIAPDIPATCFAANGAFLYAGTAADVARTPDAGMDWHLAPIPGLDPQIGSVTAIEVIGSKLLAGARDGIFLSQDSGITWQNESQGIQGAAYFDSCAVSFALEGNYVFASTGNGVWRRPLSDLPLAASPAGVMTGTQPVTGVLNYPNPFSGSTTITFNAPNNGVVELTVLNVLGMEVTKLLDGDISAGEHSYVWDARGIAPGMYECIVLENGKVQTLPMLVK